MRLGLRPGLGSRPELMLGGLLVLLGCNAGAPDATASPQDLAAPPTATDEASAQASAAPTTGAPVLLDVPLISGDAEPLSRSHGRVVVLMLSSTDLPGWAAFREHYEARLQTIGRGRLTVIAVANDADVRALRMEWDRDPPPFLMGWDPDGALALRLGVSSLPAAFVLDPQGRPLGSVAGMDAAALRELDAWIDASLPSAPPLEPDPPAEYQVGVDRSAKDRSTEAPSAEAPSAEGPSGAHRPEAR